eukprot:c16356_g1_i2 orf=32-1462(-)
MELDEQNLLCCEEMISSPSWSSWGPSPLISLGRSSSSEQELEQLSYLHSITSSSWGVMPAVDDMDMIEDSLTVQLLLEKQLHYLPPKSYLCALKSTQMCAERCRAVRWLLKAHSVFHFSPLTAALAVNYFDRYLAQNITLVRYEFLSWKEWMLELLSVACLSIAAKMEEIEVPALLDLQIDGLEHSFHGGTVQRMELAILNSLDWKLRSVTPFTFAEKAISHLDVGHCMKNLLLERVAELLLGTLPELEFLGFQPSVIAVSSICCALEESVPVQADALKAWLLTYIPSMEEKSGYSNVVNRCCRVLEELVVDPVMMISNSAKSESPTSPMGVLPLHAPSIALGAPDHHAAQALARSASLSISSGFVIAAMPHCKTSVIVIEEHTEDAAADDIRCQRHEEQLAAANDGVIRVLHCDHGATHYIPNNISDHNNDSRRLLGSSPACVEDLQFLRAAPHTNEEYAGADCRSPKRQRTFQE